MTLKSFLKDEAGAVTVDWVVLTGIVVAFALAVALLRDPINNAVGNIANKLETST